MYALLPLSAMASGHTEGPPPAETSPGWGIRQPQGAAGERRRVTIYRESLDTPWGFRLQGGKELNAPLSVKRVFSGSPADGHLAEDDRVLAIDDRPVEGLSSAEILDAIRLSGLFIVLNIETGLYDPAFDSKPESTHDTTHFQKPVHHTEPTKPAVIASDYDPQRPSAFASYEKSPQYYNRPTASTYQPPSVTASGRQRPANRFQAAPQQSLHGQSEPGWTPKLNPTAKGPLPTTAAAQHRSARQPTTPQGSDAARWSSPYSTVEEPEVPAWYGSLRSTRAPHSWEVRAARVQSPVYEHVPQTVPPTEPAQSARIEPEQPTQPKEGRTYKTEIRGLVLSRPSYQHAQSTPAEWAEGTSGGQHYYTSGQAQSAPTTPSADATLGGTVDPSAETGPHPVAAPAQEDDGSTPVRIQPSVLFGSIRSIKAAQSPPTHTREALRAQQPREVKVTLHLEHAKEGRKVSGAQPVAAPKVQQPVAKQVPTLQTKSAPSTGVVERFNPVPDRPLSSAVERFNPTPDRPQKEILIQKQPDRLSSAVERFNPTPDRPEKLAKVSSTSKPHVKVAEQSVERFNPTPDRGRETTVGLKSSVSPRSVKSLPSTTAATTVERFNPTPDKQEKPTKPLAAQKVPPTKAESTSQRSAARSTNLTTSSAPAERFNPTPDRPQVKAKAAYSTGSFIKAPLERFNPTPDAPLRLPRTRIERFNPVPDRP